MELIEPWKTLFTDQVRYLDTLVIGHCNKRTQVKCVLQNLATKININPFDICDSSEIEKTRKTTHHSKCHSYDQVHVEPGMQVL